MTVLSCLCALSVSAQADFDIYFESKSLRFDFALSGNALSQSAALQSLREEPVWGGPVKNLIDPFEYGGYYVKVFDRETDKLIYSRGFNTLFEEWRTTGQAKTETQSWTNSISVPYPKKAVTLELLARDRTSNLFAPLLKLDVDPQSIYIDRSPLKNQTVEKVQYKGDPAGKVDLVFVPEGYTASEMEKFSRDAARFARALFETPPYDTQQDAFNIWAVHLPSEESGVDISGDGVFKNTALNAGFYTFGIERYLTTPDMKSIRDAVWNVPCDAIFLLVNSAIYGGGGMYNFYAIGTADNPRTIRVFVHELGHSFAGLADEYFQSEVAYNDFYNPEVEPWEPNITTLVDFAAKWQDMLAPDTPVPTPPETPYLDRIGVFEGGGYLPKGIYRPVDHCTMRDMAPFCPVCSRAILQMIDFITDK
ncbi:MAG: IgA Peptidase M64 [Tannerella sp.]|nr:IgA Peptidase M64 [Tannerella sp.]